MHVACFLLLGAMALQCRTSSADVVLQNNKYNNLVVALDPSSYPTTLEEEKEIVTGIKELLTEASLGISEATERRASFGEITIVLPENWNSKADRDASGRWETWKDGNVRVVETERHTHAPTTVPGGGCGVPGVRLEVPRSYVTNVTLQKTYGKRGTVLAAEWLKYRYGVFEEHGYPGDRIYPHAYLDVDSNTTRPTGCTHQEGLTGSWRNRDGEECDVTSADGTLDSQCRFTIEDSSADYSIMFISHLEKVKHVCNKQTHNPLPPTPQNKRCRGQSVWEIILKHDDFADGKNPPDTSGTSTVPKFTTVKATKPALYLLIDDNCGRKPGENGDCYGKMVYDRLKDYMREVLKSDIPRIGMRKYFNRASGLYKRKPLIPLSEINVEDFISFFPNIERHDNMTKPEEALVKALNDIARSDYEGEVNLLLVQMTQTEEDGSKYPAGLQDRITVSGLLYGDAGFNEWLPSLTKETNGKFLFNSDYNPAEAQDLLVELTPGFDEVTLLHEEIQLESEVTLEFAVDGTIGINTKFVVIFSDKEGKFVLRHPSGEELPEGTTSIEDTDPGVWTLTLSNPNKGKAEVKVTSNARPGILDQVEVVTWTSASSLGEVDLNQAGLAFYTSVTQGNKPVRNLDVSVTFYAAEEGSKQLKVTLRDDGHGDPDVQHQDGIYSGYVTDFSGQDFTQTEFFADVSVRPAKSRLRILPQDPFAEEPCCGSESSDAIDLMLSRHLTGATSVTVINGPGAAPYNPPPSQITTVEMMSVDQDGPSILAGTVLVSLRWLAPGKDFTAGKVTDYEVWYSDSKEAIFSGFDDCELVKDDEYEGGKPVPGDYGTQQTAMVRLPKKMEEETQYFLVVVGVDGNQRGPPSPLMGVSVTAGEIYTTQSTTAHSTSSTELTTPALTTKQTTIQSTSSVEPSTASSTEITSTQSTVQSTSSREPSVVTSTTVQPPTTLSTISSESPTPEFTSTSSESPTSELTTSTQFLRTKSTSPHSESSTSSRFSTSQTTSSTEPLTETPETSQSTSQSTVTKSTPTEPTGSQSTESSNTISTGTTDSLKETEPPEDFVGSTGFWVMIGVLSASLVSATIIAIYCYRRKKRAVVKPRNSQELHPTSIKKKHEEGVADGDGGHDSVTNHHDSVTNLKESPTSLPEIVVHENETKTSNGVSNGGFIEDTAVSPENADASSDDDDMTTSL